MESRFWPDMRRQGRQLSAAATSFSGFDDEYNTIEGLGHSGIAWIQRRQMTDFGSGLMTRVFGGMKGFLRTKGEEVLPRVAEYARVELNVIRRRWRGGSEGVGVITALDEKLPYSLLDWNTSKIVVGHAKSGKTLVKGNTFLFKELKQGVYIHEVSEAFYGQRKLAMGRRAGAQFGTHESPGVVADEMLGAAKLGPEYYRAMRAFRLTDLAKMRQSLVLFPQASASKRYVDVTRRMISSFEKKWLPRIASGSKEWNTITGMQEGGLAEWLRKQGTPFGSPWDPLRAIAKEVVGVTKKSWARNAAKLSEEAYTSFLEGAAFQRTLIQSNKVIRGLGEGSFGKAELMETTFGGKKFQYVRKTPLHEEGVAGAYGEYRKMRQLQAFGVPTPYGLVAAGPAKGTIYMEYIPGREAKGLWEAGELTAGHVQQIESTLKEAHTRGFAHFDVWRRVQGGELRPYNMRVTPQGQVAVIDWGVAKPAGQTVGEILRGEGTGNPHILFDPAYLPVTAAETDRMLVESLNRQLGLTVNRASQQVAPVAPDALSGLPFVAQRQVRVVPPAPSALSLPAQNLQQRHAVLSQVLRRDQERMWSNARSGGHKHHGPEAFASTIQRDTIVDAIGFANTLIR